MRPEVAERVFRDEDGAVVDYGRRWGGGSPPEHTYSLVSHPEHFAPLWTVADALVGHLIEHFAVEVVDDVDVAADLVHPVRDVVRAVRLTPPSVTAASMTFALTAHPSVVVHAGLLHDFPFPGCACDACDATWQNEADDLERLAAAVAQGRYGERVTRWPRPWVHFAYSDEHGEVTGGGVTAANIPAARRREARPVLTRLGGRLGGPWDPWPVRG